MIPLIPGSLIYFDPFKFNDGSEKPKYFLVLKVIGDDVIIATLPSSKIHLPSSQELAHGCLEQPANGINCYIFEANKKVCVSGWSFPRLTIVHAHWLDEYRVDALNATYAIPNVDYDIVGQLLDDVLSALIECFVNSKVVKRKFRKLLQ